MTESSQQFGEAGTIIDPILQIKNLMHRANPGCLTHALLAHLVEMVPSLTISVCPFQLLETSLSPPALGESLNLAEAPT